MTHIYISHANTWVIVDFIYLFEKKCMVTVKQLQYDTHRIFYIISNCQVGGSKEITVKL